MIDLKTILTLFNLENSDFDVDPIIVENSMSTNIFVTLKDDKVRECPICHSHNVIINDHHVSSIKNHIVNSYGKSIILKVQKTKYLCKDCKHKFYQKTRIAEPTRRISNDTCWLVHKYSQEQISFKTIGKILNISTPKVISIFDEIVNVRRKKLPECLAIDEKSFKTKYGKFICILSDAYSGDIIDILPGRTKDVLNSYFDSIDILERKNVQFITSDMFEGYKTVAKRYFPQAIHIIDHFHVKKLFTEAIQTIRVKYMKTLEKNSVYYNFLKNNWKSFLVDKNKPRKNKEKIKFVIDENGEKITTGEMAKRIIKISDNLREIHNLYCDFNDYVYFGQSEEQINDTLDFVIQKCMNSSLDEIKKIGSTFSEFYQELKNTYCFDNLYELTNAVAEGNNNFIDTIIKISYGCTDFERFRKRILHIKSSKNRGE